MLRPTWMFMDCIRKQIHRPSCEIALLYNLKTIILRFINNEFLRALLIKNCLILKHFSIEAVRESTPCHTYFIEALTYDDTLHVLSISYSVPTTVWSLTHFSDGAQQEMGTIFILKSKSWFDFKSSEISMILNLTLYGRNSFLLSFFGT